MTYYRTVLRAILIEGASIYLKLSNYFRQGICRKRPAKIFLNTFFSTPTEANWSMKGSLEGMNRHYLKLLSVINYVCMCIYTLHITITTFPKGLSLLMCNFILLVDKSNNNSNARELSCSLQAAPVGSHHYHYIWICYNRCPNPTSSRSYCTPGSVHLSLNLKAIASVPST